MSAYIEALFYEMFREQGALDAASMAKRAAASIDLDKRNSKIYELRAQFTECEVAYRFGLSCTQVRKIVRAQTLLRRELAKVR